MGKTRRMTKHNKEEEATLELPLIKKKQRNRRKEKTRGDETTHRGSGKTITGRNVEMK